MAEVLVFKIVLRICYRSFFDNFCIKEKTRAKLIEIEKLGKVKDLEKLKKDFLEIKKSSLT